MTIKLRDKIKNNCQPQSVKVRIIKAPLVDNQVLRNILGARSRAVIL